MGKLSVCAVVALRLPGNVERTVNRIRNELFRATGATSTQSIAPVIPLAYVDPGTQADLVDSLRQSDTPPFPVGEVRENAEALSIAVEWSGGWEEFLAELPSESVPSGMPAPRLGIFLGARDLVDGWNDLPKTLRDEAISGIMQDLPVRLTVLHIELHSLMITARNWWEDLDWKVIWSRRVKLRGQSVTT
jgi:hypothetical protein